MTTNSWRPFHPLPLRPKVSSYLSTKRDNGFCVARWITAIMTWLYMSYVDWRSVSLVVSSAVDGVVCRRKLLTTLPRAMLGGTQVLLCHSWNRSGPLLLNVCSPVITLMKLLLCSTKATTAALEFEVEYSIDSSRVRVQPGVRTSRPNSRIIAAMARILRLKVVRSSK